MIKSSVSVAMDSALKAWAIKPPTSETLERQIMAHALAHGISVSGLRLALRRASLIPAANPRPQRVPS